MNISISLTRRKGLTLEEVAEIREGLDQQVENLKEEVRRTNRDISFWKSELKKRTPKGKCKTCKANIDLWPFNDKQGYYIKGNTVQHVECQEVKK